MPGSIVIDLRGLPERAQLPQMFRLIAGRGRGAPAIIMLTRINHPVTVARRRP